MYIWGYQTPVFIPIGSKKTSFLVQFFHFQGTIVHLGVPNSSFYPHQVKKIVFLVKFFHFLGNKCTFGGIKLQFLSPSGQKKNSFLVKYFHFQGTNVHLGVPNYSFYPHLVKKTSFLVKFFPFQGTNVHLGVPNSSFYPQFVRSGKKKLIFSEILPFLGNKCTFGGTKLQFLSPSGQKNFFFS